MATTAIPTSYRDPHFTEVVISSMGARTDPRLREVMASLIKHIHDFAKEVDLTDKEWRAGMHFLNVAGKMSNDRMDQMQLLSDVIGLESLVDEITHATMGDDQKDATATAVYGPFYTEDPPWRENGSSIIVTGTEGGEVTYLFGRITDAATGRPIPGAVINIWEASVNGLYDQQDPEQMKGNLRGRFKADSDGRYAIYCLRPTPYPVPPGVPATELLDFTDRHHYRPAHIHLVVKHESYNTCCTQIYPDNDPYLMDDAAFAVIGALVRKFEPRKGDPQATLQVEFDIQLGPKQGKSMTNGVNGVH